MGIYTPAHYESVGMSGVLDYFSTSAYPRGPFTARKHMLLTGTSASSLEAAIDEVTRISSIDNECNRELKARFYGYKNADEMDAAYALDDYLRELDDDRKKWFSEQYIYDSLGM